MPKIALIFNRESESTTGCYLEKVIKTAGIDYTHYWTRDAQRIPREFDLYLRVDHGDYKDDLPVDMHPAVFYVIDTHLKKPYKKIRRQARHYDIVFCCEVSGAERLSHDTRVDVQRVPLGCDPEVHKKLDVPKIYDIGFVGRDAQKFDRGRHLRILKEKYPNSFIGAADYTRMSEIYSASKIGFNSSIANGINMRTFEIMSCGCFLLMNRIKDNGFDEMFENGTHLVTYNNEREMLSLIDYYLEHDEERERIAAAGCCRVRENFTYFHTMQKIFNYVAFKFGGVYNGLRI